MTMTDDEGVYGKTVPDDNPRDTRPDLKKTCVILDVRFRDGSKFTGWKEYADREEWAASSREERLKMLAGVAEKLMDAIEAREQ